ncbi:MAG: hypothetical protein NTY68_03650 [Candidatus Micrarchaeota archaeon]|nr:hypothetical protein [Candidatus Micrarchaeota archaeon]
MRLIYKAGFRTGTKQKAELKDIVAVVREWANKKNIHVPEFADEIQKESNGIAVKGAFMDKDGMPCFAFEITHPDASNKSLLWRSTIALAKNAMETFDTEIALYIGWADNSNRPLYPISTRPTIVPELIYNFGAECGFDLTCSPILLSSDMVKPLVERIFDPGRKLPILIISARNITDRPVLDQFNIERITHLLAGTALVYVAKNKFPSIRLEEHAGKSMGCYNGAARLYWPIPAEGERPYHPYWTVPNITLMERKFANHLLLRVAAYTVGLESQVSHGALMEHKAEGKRKLLMMDAKLQDTLKDHNELQQLLDMYIGDNDGLKKQVAYLTSTIEDLERKLAAALGRIEHLTNALEARKAAPEEQEQEQAALVFRNVLEAVEQIKRSYSENTIVITPKALKGAKESLYEEPADVHAALEWLATTYLEDGTRNPEDLKASCLQRCRMTYNPGQGNAMVFHPEDYHVTYQNKKYSLREHLAKGTSRDGRRTIRIGFAYDDENRRVIVGYISQHQTTEAT